eukprot:TRINITY_DN451_c0_g1_i3.p1 TRINITY_DN451_c0_g1~~TRINITY_DN451_c0_g1_i3.p1  ORF type:complete len:446 (+),score=34.43 TRINITY_DN451_c0_g1_i3:191-1528(+)
MSKYTEGKLHFFLSSLQYIRTAVLLGLDWVQNLPVGILNSSQSFEFSVKNDKPLALATDVRFNKGRPIKYSGLLKDLHSDRVDRTFITSLANIGNEFVVSVGHIVEIISPAKVRSNWLLYITELHCTGFGEPGGSGYFVYTDADIRNYKTCSTFKSNSEHEVYLTNHRYHFLLSNVREVVDVKPAIFYVAGQHFGFYESFFDTAKLSLRKIDFHDQTEPYSLLQRLQSDAVCQNPSILSFRAVFVKIFLERLQFFCERKGAPTTPSRPNFIVPLSAIDSLLCLPDHLLQAGLFNRGSRSFILRFERTAQLDGFLGVKWHIRERLAKKTGTENLKFVIVPPVTFVFPIEGVEFKATFGGLKKYNASNSLFWDTTAVPRKQRKPRQKRKKHQAGSHALADVGITVSASSNGDSYYEDTEWLVNLSLAYEYVVGNACNPMLKSESAAG